MWDQLDGVLVANQRWLAGYRHPRCFDEAIAARLLTVFSQDDGSVLERRSGYVGDTAPVDAGRVPGFDQLRVT